MLALRATPDLPDPNVQPPTIAEPGDPFATLRVVHLVARIPRGVPVRVRDLTDRLNADHVDWSFSRGVVVTAIVQLQSNWLSDFRTSEGIALAEDASGVTVTIEDTPRVDAWIARQCHRLHEACVERLRVFALEEGAIP